MRRLRFYNRLYISPGIRHPKAVLWRLRHNAGNLALYVVTLPDGQEGAPESTGSAGVNLLQFMHCANLHQPWYRQHPPMILGIAEGRHEAIQLVCRILEECHAARGDYNVAGFLSELSHTGRKAGAP